MVKRRLVGLGVCAGAVMLSAWGCGGSNGPTSPVEDPDNIDPRVEVDAGTGGETDAGTDAGTGGETDAGTDAGTGGETDAGTDAGTGGETDAGTDAGTVVDPWPEEPVTNYSDRYGIGKVKSVGIDLGKNIWVLDGDRIGVVRADTQKLVWVAGPVGQASVGQSSTVICGGEAGRAYVGYNAPGLGEDPEWSDIHPNFIVTAKPCEVPVNETTCFPYSTRRLNLYKQGDVDAVKLDASGKVVLESHINQSRRANVDANGKPFIQTGPTEVDGVSLGIRNSNDHHFDEDRAMLSCASVLRGPNKGDVFFGTNHGVVRLRGLTFNAHRHPVWFKKNPDKPNADGSQQAGYTYGLGIAPDGDVLIANDWNFGTVTPDTKLETWDDTTTKTINQQKVKSSFLHSLNSQEEFDYWRGFQQTTDGKYYLGSNTYGLWEMTIGSATDPSQMGTRIGADVPALNKVNALASTNDGSLFIGTDTGGLYRLTPAKTLEKVAGVRGSEVKQLVYDGSGTSGMLLVLTSEGLTVLRGY